MSNNERKIWSPSRGTLLTEGLIFNEEKHQYFYRGNELSGVTGTIGKKLKKDYSKAGDFVEEGRTQGNHVHDALEKWIKTGEITSVHPASTWAVEELTKRKARFPSFFFAEVLVSDFKIYASAVDVMHYFNDKTCDLIDTKAGIFYRDSVSLQLGIYKFFVEEYMGFTVNKCWCLSTKDKEMYPVFPATKAEVKELLYKGR